MHGGAETGAMAVRGAAAGLAAALAVAAALAAAAGGAVVGRQENAGAAEAVAKAGGVWPPAQAEWQLIGVPLAAAEPEAEAAATKAAPVVEPAEAKRTEAPAVAGEEGFVADDVEDEGDDVDDVEDKDAVEGVGDEDDVADVGVADGMDDVEEEEEEDQGGAVDKDGVDGVENKDEGDADADADEEEEEERTLRSIEHPLAILGILVGALVATGVPLVLCCYCGCARFLSAESADDEWDAGSRASRRKSLDCSAGASAAWGVPSSRGSDWSGGGASDADSDADSELSEVELGRGVPPAPPAPAAARALRR